MADDGASRIRSRADRSSLGASPYAIAVRAADGSAAEVGVGLLGGGLAVGPDTMMYAASIAKQVIGTLAAQQVVDGRLDPGEPLAGHLDELPSWSRVVQVRHLVHHTSGLPTEPQRDSGVGNAEVLAQLRALTELEATPGTAYRYSNVGYICLAEVVSRVAGRRVEELAADLFARLGLSTARLDGVVPENLHGQQPPPVTVGDGGLWLSARDLRTWNDAMNARSLGALVHAVAETPGTLNDGTPLDYAWGVRIIDHAGRRTVSHGGSWPSWTAKAIRQPDAGVSVAILTTCPDADDVTAVALDLADGLASTPDWGGSR